MRTTSEAAPPAVRYKIGLVQMAMSADPDANLNTAVAKVAEAAAAGARLVCLPELFRSRYFAQHEDAASKPGRYVARVGVCQVDGYDITAEFEVY